MKNKALVIGASGLIGKSLTMQLAESNNYEKVIVLVRKKMAIVHPKVEQKIIDYDKINKIQLHAEHIFCCLGTTIKKAGSKDAFRKVDYEYPVEIAKIAEKEKSKLYAIVTAMGANADSRIFYNKVKGETESDLAKLNIPSIGIFRPSMLLGDRDERRMGEVIGKVFMQIFDFMIPAKYKAIHVDVVAKAILQYAKSPQEGVSIIENDAMLA